MKISDLVQRIDQLIKMGEDVVASKRNTGGQYGIVRVDSGLIAGFRSAALSFIDRMYGAKHPHFSEFFRLVDGNQPGDAEQGIAILKAIRDEIEGGWLFSMKGLITAEVFADFLEMAEHLHSTGYKDPAAVMAGSVLEEHLRQLCQRNDIPLNDERDGDLVPKKSERLNADLAKGEVYTKLDQKQITAWLDLRNKAAHGKYSEYNADQVGRMLSGITEFMVRVTL